MGNRPRAASNEGGAWPTFFVIGAARCGTTSVHHYLSLHPEIQMSRVKEPHFFGGPPGDLPYGTKRIERPDVYRGMFDNRWSVRGESSPSYSVHPRRVGVAGRIKEIVDVKAIREAERWEDHARIEDVMDLESFVHLRTQIWRSLREEKGLHGV